jgi:Uncharacterized protein conserved in bacteria
MQAPDSPVLLDTHVWVWLVGGGEKLSSQATAAIRAAAKEGSVLVSAISVWEVAMLEKKGRLKFDRDCLEWVHAALSLPGLTLSPLSPEITVASTRLPGDFGGDPADRILAATARLVGARLVTRDRQILRYGKAESLSVIRA